MTQYKLMQLIGQSGMLDKRIVDSNPFSVKCGGKVYTPIMVATDDSVAMSVIVTDTATGESYRIVYKDSLNYSSTEMPRIHQDVDTFEIKAKVIAACLEELAIQIKNQV